MPIRPRSGSFPRRVPQEVVFQFLGTRMFETEDLAALGIDARHHMLNGAVLPGSVHRLKDQQHGIAVGRVKQALMSAQFFNVFSEEPFVLLFRIANGFHPRRPLVEIDLLPSPHAEVVGIDFLHRYRPM